MRICTSCGRLSGSARTSASSSSKSVTDPALADPVFDIYVADDGIPREAQLRFSITGTSEGEPVRIDYIVDYVFSAVGEPVDIVAPDLPG